MTGQPRPAATRILDLAVARIARDGMSVGLDGLRMEALIEEAGVSRATAYRRWPHRDAFLTEVLVETVHRTALIPESADDIAQVLSVVHAEPASLLRAQARRDLVVEALRVASNLDIRRIASSPAWRTYLSISATYPGLPAGQVRTEVGQALAATSRAFDTRRSQIYSNLAGLLGYRLVGTVTGHAGFQALAEASGAMMTGIVTRALADPAWLDERTDERLYGSSRSASWSMPERHLVGVVLAALEPDPTIRWTKATVIRQFEEFSAQIGELMARVSRPVS